MQALVKAAPMPGAVELRELPAPEPGPGEVVVAVEAAGVCGTDLALVEWHHDVVELYHPPLPLALGHEFAGRVAALGKGVKGLSPGDLVAVNPILHCGRCLYCRRGMTSICDNRRLIGGQLPGAFAELVAAPARQAYRLPDDVPSSVAALAEPLCVALHALERAPVTSGDVVTVVGAGPIGLLIALAALDAGAKRCVVTGRDSDAHRLRAAERLGATPVNVDRDEPVGAVRDLTAGEGADVAFEAAGHPAAFAQALAVARKGARIGVVGFSHAPAAFATTDLAATEQELVGVRAYTPATWERCVEVLPRLVEPLRGLVSHRQPLARHAEALAAAARRDGIKVMFTPNQKERKKQ